VGLKTRTYLLPLHRWIGLAASLLLLPVALTGAGMAFRTELEPLLQRTLHHASACATRLPLDTLVMNAHAAYPEAGALTRIREFPGQEASTRIAFSDEHWIFVHPCSGTVLGREARYGGLFGTLGYVHGFRYLESHKLIAGSVALGVALLIVLGIAIWWPASRRGFAVASKMNLRLQGRALSLNLHRTLGLYASAILLVSALTGIPQAFAWAEQAIYLIAGHPVAASMPPLPAPTIDQRVRLDDVVQHAQQRVPHYRKMQMRFPQTAGAPLHIELVAPDAPHMQALTRMTVDATTGEVMQFIPYAQSSLGQRIFQWMLAVHYGWVGGMAGQLLLFLAAICIPVLAWTGLRNYFKR
jgi:uncharacterized iron-regulated membrane protein